MKDYSYYNREYNDNGVVERDSQGNVKRKDEPDLETLCRIMVDLGTEIQSLKHTIRGKKGL